MAHITMRLHQSLVFFISTCALVASEMQIKYPQAGISLVGSQSYNVSWTDSNTVPLVQDVSYYSIVLCSGNNSNPVPIITYPTRILKDTPTRGNVANATATWLSLVEINSTIGKDLVNGYFLGITSHFRLNDSIKLTEYSARFGLTNMSGTLPTEILGTEYSQSINSTIGPTAVYSCGEVTNCTRTKALASIKGLSSPIITSDPDSTSPKKYFFELSQEGWKFLCLGLGSFGLVFTLMCLTIVLFFCSSEIDKRPKWLRTHYPSIKWWDNLSSPRGGVAELSGPAGLYATPELIGDSEHKPVFYELPTPGNDRHQPTEKNSQTAIK